VISRLISRIALLAAIVGCGAADATGLTAFRTDNDNNTLFGFKGVNASDTLNVAIGLTGAPVVRTYPSGANASPAMLLFAAKAVWTTTPATGDVLRSPSRRRSSARGDIHHHRRLFMSNHSSLIVAALGALGLATATTHAQVPAECKPPVYVLRTESDGSSSDVRVWIAKSTGLELREDGDLDPGGGAGETHITTRFDHSNVLAPAGAP